MGALFRAEFRHPSQVVQIAYRIWLRLSGQSNVALASGSDSGTFLLGDRLKHVQDLTVASLQIQFYAQC